MGERCLPLIFLYNVRNLISTMYVYHCTQNENIMNGYEIYLMIELAKCHGLIVHEQEYDLAWNEGKEFYVEFTKSEFNIDTEPEYDCINPPQAMAALKAADFVVCLTAFDSDAMRDYADVLLPAAPYSETSGTFVNAAGTWQRFSANCAPFNETRPAWKILR
ncbi:MAG: molybdopterin-dependent oxidoreductase, partial [Candidatus Heimdallarchaeota archaeon]